MKMLSYNQFLNFIIGGRGIGKTFSIKKYLFKRFIEKGEQFIYIRRNKSELDRIDKDKFFTTELLEQIFKDFVIENMETSKLNTKIMFSCSNKGFEDRENILTITSTKVILNGKIVCYMKSLSTWVDLKGSEYDEVFSVLFDEVIIDPVSKKRYLDNEVEALMQMLISIFRRRKGCHAYLLSNAGNFNNPYFAYFKFYENVNKRFYNLRQRATLFEFPPNTMKHKEDEDNPIFKLISGSKIEKSVLENEFQIKEDNNIGKLRGEKLFLYSFYINNEYISCYLSNGLIYVTKGHDKNIVSFTIEKSDIEEGKVYLERSSVTGKKIKKNFLNNLYIYSDLEVKQNFGEVINHVF